LAIFPESSSSRRSMYLFIISTLSADTMRSTVKNYSRNKAKEWPIERAPFHGLPENILIISEKKG